MSQATSIRQSSSFISIPSVELLDPSPVPATDPLSPASTLVNAASPVSLRFDGRLSVSPHSGAEDSPKALTLIEAVAQGQLHVVARLLEQKADVDQQDGEENTALHLAAAHVNGAAIAKLLIHSGASHKVNKQGKYAFQLAEDNKRSDILHVFNQSRAVEFHPVAVPWMKESFIHVEKRRSPLTGRVMVFCRDATSRLARIYQHEKVSGPLSSGVWKSLKPLLQDNVPDAVRLVIRTKGRSEEYCQQIQRNFDRLVFFAKQVGEPRGILLPDIIISNKSVKDGTFSVDSYVKHYNIGDLFKFFETGVVLNDVQKLQLFRDILWGLHAIHKSKIAHCDIKPENIVVHKISDSNLKAALIDFDLCAYSNDENNAGGSPGYNAPEISDLSIPKWSVEARQAADMWSVGIVLYWIAYDWQIPPLPGMAFSPQELKGYCQRLQYILKSNPDAVVFSEPRKDCLGHIVWQMLQYNKDKRITAEEALRQLEALYPEHTPTSSAAAAAAVSVSVDPEASPSVPVSSAAAGSSSVNPDSKDNGEVSPDAP